MWPITGAHAHHASPCTAQRSAVVLASRQHSCRQLEATLSNAAVHVSAQCRNLVQQEVCHTHGLSGPTYHSVVHSSDSSMHAHQLPSCSCCRASSSGCAYIQQPNHRKHTRYCHNCTATSLALGLYCNTCTAALLYCRLLTHRSFKTYKIVEYILTMLAVMTDQGAPMVWVSNHR